MILYNVTVKIEHAIQEDWTRWMRSVHIPDVMATGLFQSYKMCQLVSVDDTDGVTYAIQYFCTDMAAIYEYQQKHAARLQKEHSERYRNKYVAFRTLMEVLHEG